MPGYIPRNLLDNDPDGLFGYQPRSTLYPGEDSYFKSNPQVAGMAAQDNHIILNPYSPNDAQGQQAVARNEASRLYMRNNNIVPDFALTDEQRSQFKGTAYENADPEMHQTIAARIYSGDPSAKNITPEQQAFVDHRLNGEPTYRMSMLPFGTYADPNGGGEHLGFAMPGMISEPVNALMRLAQNSRFDDGHLGIPNPQNLDNQHDTATLIESLFGGNATRGAGAGEAVAARALSDTGKPSLFGAVAGAERQPLDLWHGSPHDFDQFDMSNLGKGEGGSTFGVGVNLSDHRPYAEQYSDPTLENPGSGYLYQVGADVDPSKLVGWDTKIADQPEPVKAALKNILDALPDDQFAQHFGDLDTHWTGASFLHALDRALPGGETGTQGIGWNVGPNKNVSDALAAQGLAGHHYPEPAHFGMEGVRNYVMYDPAALSVKHKWQGDKQLYSDNVPSFLNPALSQDQNDPRNSFFTY